MNQIIHAGSPDVRFRVANPDQVADYLDKNPGLAECVTAVLEGMKAEFGSEAAFVLEYRHDPLGYDSILRLTMRLPAYGRDTFKRIDAVTDTHTAALERAGGGLVVTTDYGPLG